jgi:hypothetical protein
MGSSSSSILTMPWTHAGPSTPHRYQPRGHADALTNGPPARHTPPTVSNVRSGLRTFHQIWTPYGETYDDTDQPRQNALLVHHSKRRHCTPLLYGLRHILRVRRRPPRVGVLLVNAQTSPCVRWSSYQAKGMHATRIRIRNRPQCGYMGCQRTEYHAGVCSVNAPSQRRHIPVALRIAPSTNTHAVPVAYTLISSDELDTLFDHCIGDPCFTVSDIDELARQL